MTGSPGSSWESAFVAVATVAGEPLDAVVAALGPRVGEGAGQGLAGGAGAGARDLVQTLRGGSRDARARALARTLAEVALALDPWGSA